MPTSVVDALLTEPLLLLKAEEVLAMKINFMIDSMWP